MDAPEIAEATWDNGTEQALAFAAARIAEEGDALTEQEQIWLEAGIVAGQVGMLLALADKNMIASPS